MDCYEASVSKRGKKTIEVLEEEVELARTHTDDTNISEEVDWLVDPGTPSTRHTQFLQTQVVAWQVKTMLAKAIAMQGAAVKETFAATTIASAQNTARLDKLEIALNSLTTELKLQGTAMEKFVHRFEIYLRHVHQVSIELPSSEEQATVIRRFKPRAPTTGGDGIASVEGGHSGASTPNI